MLHRQDANLVVEGGVALAKHDVGSETWRGLDFQAGGAFTIPDVRRFASFRAFPRSCGWKVKTSSRLALKVSFRRSGSDAELTSRSFSGEFQAVTLPWPKEPGGSLDLRVEAVGRSRGSIFLGNHRALSREWLLKLATGTGIEIGPGHQPQILPREGVDVSYLEQVPPKEWNELYNRSGKYPVRHELWNNYIVGDASDLPVPDGSLEFIFGSHVFEHLVNPIGHLHLWKSKLAPGGLVICIVPDLAGTRDALQERSTLEEWRREFKNDLWQPTPYHYGRHFGLASAHPYVKEAHDRGESIHAHYYDNLNCQILLDYAVHHLGYADYVIEHTPNHKDFHFVLKNA